MSGSSSVVSPWNSTASVKDDLFRLVPPVGAIVDDGAKMKEGDGNEEG
jgi:hypothetical protein